MKIHSTTSTALPKLLGDVTHGARCIVGWLQVGQLSRSHMSSRFDRSVAKKSMVHV